MGDQPSHRRFQFRLRTLMIVVTLAAGICWVVRDRQRLIRERDAAKADLIRERISVDLERRAIAANLVEMRKAILDEKYFRDMAIRIQAVLARTKKNPERDEELIQLLEMLLSPPTP